MRRFAFIVAGVIAWFALSAGVLEANHERLDICCAWNNELADGELTYSVSGGDAGARAAVESAVLDWNAVPGLTLVEDETAPNIKVQLKNGGGTIAGQAQRRFDNAGFVREVRLIISGKSFGDPNLEDTLKEITRHETGHALGLSHANFVGSLMDPTVGGEDQIKQCEISGVQAANAWFFGGGGTPAQPTVDSVACSEGPGGTDIFLTALEVSSSTVNQGDTVSFTTTAVNHGQADPLDDITATLTVTRDSDSVEVDTYSIDITLDSGDVIQLEGTWNSTGADLGNYTIEITLSLTDGGNDEMASASVEVVEGNGGGGGPPACVPPWHPDCQ